MDTADPEPENCPAADLFDPIAANDIATIQSCPAYSSCMGIAINASAYSGAECIRVVAIVWTDQIDSIVVLRYDTGAEFYLVEQRLQFRIDPELLQHSRSPVAMFVNIQRPQFLLQNSKQGDKRPVMLRDITSDFIPERQGLITDDQDRVGPQAPFVFDYSNGLFLVNRTRALKELKRNTEAGRVRYSVVSAVEHCESSHLLDAHLLASAGLYYYPGQRKPFDSMCLSGKS